MDIDGGEVHQRVIVPQGAGKVLDIPLCFGNGGLDGDDVLHVFRLGQQLLQPLQLDLLGLQAARRVIIGLCDVFQIGVPPRHMGKLPGLIQKALKLSGGHPDGIIRPPVAPAPAAYGAALQIAALDLRQRCQRLNGLVKRRGLQIDVSGVDDLLVFQNTSSAVPALVIITVGVSVEIPFLLCRGDGIRRAAVGAGSRSFAGGSAGSQAQEHGQCKKTDK